MTRESLRIASHWAVCSVWLLGLVGCPDPKAPSSSSSSTGSGVVLFQPGGTPTLQPPPAPLRNIGETLARGDGSPADGWLARADQAYAQEQYQRALSDYEKAAQLAPEDAAPVVGVVRCKLALADVPTGVNSAPDNPTALSAISLLNGALTLKRSHPAAHLELGRTLLILGEIQRARTPLEQALKLAPDDAETLSSLGIVQLLSGERQAAVTSLKKAAQLDPNNAERHANLGTVLLQAGQLADAVKSYQEAVRRAPDDPRHYTNLGTAFMQADDLHSALPHLEKAVELSPDEPTFLSNLGFAKQRAKKPQEALALFRKAVKLDPKLGSAWINLGNTLAQQKDYAGAREAYLKAQALDPEDPRVREVLRELDELEKKEPKP